MPLTIERATPARIAASRTEFLAGLGAQFVNHSWLARGFSDAYALLFDGALVGHALVGGVGDEPRTTLTELHIASPHAGNAGDYLRLLVAASGADRIRAQSNDILLHRLLREFTDQPMAQAILFGDTEAPPPSPPDPGLLFRRIDSAEVPMIFPHHVEPVGDCGLELAGRVVATGGILTHYNAPFADLFMEVHPDHWRRGIGSFLVGRLRAECHARGLVPAARCNPGNHASRACLSRAGLRPCGELLEGRLHAGTPSVQGSGRLPRSIHPH